VRCTAAAAVIRLTTAAERNKDVKAASNALGGESNSRQTHSEAPVAGMVVVKHSEKHQQIKRIIRRKYEVHIKNRNHSRINASFGDCFIAQHVKTDYDHNANFGQYKTYSWEKVQTKDPLLVDRIKSAVNSALAAKGLTEVPSGGDVEVFAIETTQNQQTLDTFYNGFGEVAVGEDSVDLATQPRPSKPTKWEP